MIRSDADWSAPTAADLKRSAERALASGTAKDWATPVEFEERNGAR
jgi:hypothetical protein